MNLNEVHPLLLCEVEVRVCGTPSKDSKPPACGHDDGDAFAAAEILLL
jgi:hypothetical protein